jgi:hypothetical protein
MPRFQRQGDPYGEIPSTDRTRHRRSVHGRCWPGALGPHKHRLGGARIRKVLAGAHTLSTYGAHVYPETGNGGYQSVHTNVNMVRRGCAAAALRARLALRRAGCGDSVGILKIAAGACAIFTSSLSAF